MPLSLRTTLLLLIVILEGYVVLSSELLAIRLTTPFVGSGTDTISIIIAGVLIPLAFGYQAGGKFTPGIQPNGKYLNIRKKLIRNLFISLCFLTVGLSYVMVNDFFYTAPYLILQTDHRLILTGVYSALFLAPPVYLLGQTIPLISRYFRQEKTAPLAGKILCLSTLGSFLGAVFSTTVIMAFLGINYAASINFVFLATLILLLSKRKTSKISLFTCVLLLIGIAINSNSVLKSMNVIASNQYHTARLFENDIGKALSMNSNLSALLQKDGRRNDYIEFMEKRTNLAQTQSRTPKEILVIGAGGFTFGLEDKFNSYEFIDIDPHMKDIAEDHFLPNQLTPNKKFIPSPARAFLNNTNKKYDIIIIDAYIGRVPPEHLLTVQFFEQVKAHIKDEGLILAHLVLPVYLDNQFSRNVNNTILHALPNSERHSILIDYEQWKNRHNYGSVIYTYQHLPELKEKIIYTDIKNHIFYDKPKR